MYAFYKHITTSYSLSPLSPNVITLLTIHMPLSLSYVPSSLLVQHLFVSHSLSFPSLYDFLFSYHPTFLFPSRFFFFQTLCTTYPTLSLSLSLPLCRSLLPLYSGRLLLHDKSLSGSRVWGGSGPVFLLGHHLRWSHVHIGSHWDPSGGFWLCHHHFYLSPQLCLLSV